MTRPNPLLYTYRRCPYAMRARMALLWAGIAFDAFEITLRDKPLGMLSASPKGTVPVLVLLGGQVLEESWDIVEWALSQTSIGTDAREAWRLAQTPENQQLLNINDTDFKHHLDRYKYPERLNKKKDSTDVRQDRQAHRDQAVRALLEPLEQKLTHTDFLGGTQACATDIGIFPFVRQFAAVDSNWFDTLPLGRVKTWLAYWRQSLLFETCMRKLPSNTAVSFGDWARVQD
jgi:glutathione S-transferase